MADWQDFHGFGTAAQAVPRSQLTTFDDRIAACRQVGQSCFENAYSDRQWSDCAYQHEWINSARHVFQMLYPDLYWG